MSLNKQNKEDFTYCVRRIDETWKGDLGSKNKTYPKDEYEALVAAEWTFKGLSPELKKKYSNIIKEMKQEEIKRFNGKKIIYANQ